MLNCLTVLLVLITAYYAWQTHQIVKEMQKTRRIDFLPIISIKTEQIGQDVVEISLMNIGKGLAQNVQVFFPTCDNEPRIIKSLPPFVDYSGFKNIECVAVVHFVCLDINRIIALNDSERILTVKYKDIFNEKIISETLILQDEVKSKNFKRPYLKTEGWSMTF